MLGSVMILVNSLVYGTFLVVVRSLSDKYDPIGLLALLFLVGIPMVAPFGIVRVGRRAAAHRWRCRVPRVPDRGADRRPRTGSSRPALKRAESTLVAAYIYLQPVFASIGAVLLLHEELTLRMVGCGVVVLSGVWLAARSRP